MQAFSRSLLKMDDVKDIKAVLSQAEEAKTDEQRHTMHQEVLKQSNSLLS